MVVALVNRRAKGSSKELEYKKMKEMKAMSVKKLKQVDGEIKIFLICLM